MRWLTKIIGIWLLASCSPGTAPIHYGQDACDYCRMTIMDPRFGGEIVTKKGKVYKFDSGECLVKYYQSHASEAKDFAIVVVSNFAQPGKMLDAGKAVFLQQEKIKSPMGGNLAAFANKEEADKTVAGKLIKWSDLLKTVK